MRMFFLFLCVFYSLYKSCILDMADYFHGDELSENATCLKETVHPNMNVCSKIRMSFFFAEIRPNVC